MAFTLRHRLTLNFLAVLVQAANTLEDNILAKCINGLSLVCVCISFSVKFSSVERCWINSAGFGHIIFILNFSLRSYQFSDVKQDSA